MIDAQVEFAALAGDAADAVRGAIGELLAQARAAGAPVVFTQELHRPQGVDFGRELDGAEDVHCVDGTPGAELLPGLAPRAHELLVLKRRYSAFFATDLDLLLRGLGATTIVACGFLTDVCVHYTCVDAHQLDYRVHVVPEACAGSSARAASAAVAAICYLQRGAELRLARARAVLDGRAAA